jgi:hypothetical protein
VRLAVAVAVAARRAVALREPLDLVHRAALLQRRASTPRGSWLPVWIRTRAVARPPAELVVDGQVAVLQVELPRLLHNLRDYWCLRLTGRQPSLRLRRLLPPRRARPLVDRVGLAEAALGAAALARQAVVVVLAELLVAPHPLLSR